MGIKAGKRNQPEAAFRRQVMDLARLHGFRAVHFKTSLNPRGQHLTVYEGEGKGYPDLTLVRPETAGRRPRVIFAELKAGKNTTTPEQEAWLADLRAAGMEAYTWRPEDITTIANLLI